MPIVDAVPALAARGLRRRFRTRTGPDRIALDALDLTFATGAVHGLLGPNGAGKTTLCRITCTVLLPTAGTLEVLGHDVVRDAEAVRRSVGIVFGGDRGLYGRLTARENLQFWCAMHGVPRRRTPSRITELLDRLGLGSRADDLVETYSRGMKQRLHLARGLLADPPLLVLDEPTVGMDPVSAHEFRALVHELRREGRTVLLTTHDMAEAQAVCDTVTFVDEGRVVGRGTPGSVRQLLESGGFVRVDDVDAEAVDVLRRRLPNDLVLDHDARARSATIVLPPDPDSLPHVVAVVLAAGHTNVTTGPPSLEDVYLGLLGRRDDGAERGLDVR